MAEPTAAFDVPVNPSALWSDGPQVLAALVGRIESSARKVAEGADAQVRVGRYVFSNQQTEVAVYIEKGPRIGAWAGLRWLPGQPTARLTVRCGSPIHVWLQWGSFFGVLAASFALSWALGPYENAELALALTLLLGCGAAIGALLMIAKLQLGMDVAASEELAKKLAKRLTKKLGPKGESTPSDEG
jgi:hypothetical protein